jgi:hypothetical protein
MVSILRINPDEFDTFVEDVNKITHDDVKAVLKSVILDGDSIIIYGHNQKQKHVNNTESSLHCFLNHFLNSRGSSPIFSNARFGTIMFNTLSEKEITIHLLNNVVDDVFLPYNIQFIICRCGKIICAYKGGDYIYMSRKHMTETNRNAIEEVLNKAKGYANDEFFI